MSIEQGVGAVGLNEFGIGDWLGHAIVAVAGHAYDVVAKLVGIRPGHKDIPPARPSGQANSDVTYPCS
ncbi:hypothetical protein LAUMK136_05609 [Mycobacterium attenuatum]|uniref:Uncharacterized protein n=1 Tax=Mycobacterium attenuatum TaxID=2341086 RepID=A0A498QIR7_9MYCO|nr:hypothetical protein [Mycobacterium attenuatum]VBA44395.1 hypothetical protein LAUMK136_05609 [Mycobacterium attenuatum]